MRESLEPEKLAESIIFAYGMVAPTKFPYWSFQ